ncbi:MAG: hypothetical protein FRX48_09026 [Lasallia pustulata]|uniref:Uncharacterized protein n=1 Tax=Lasallia pustulata TaxID=136370 RepID=A0A5M8PE91_9LECA|nr:MAG: hypothetical protein FRX48_09026 [Lasallia pustulata]
MVRPSTPPLPSIQNGLEGPQQNFNTFASCVPFGNEGPDASGKRRSQSPHCYPLLIAVSDALKPRYERASDC